jgi:hypothetical protein
MSDYHNFHSSPLSGEVSTARPQPRPARPDPADTGPRWSFR